jgi:hypothetical protein
MKPVKFIRSNYYLLRDVSTVNNKTDTLDTAGAMIRSVAENSGYYEQQGEK